MSTKYTPAPWGCGLREDGSMWLSIGSASGNNNHYQFNFDGYFYEDAQLIAAAPELLEALQMFMKAGVGNSSDHGMQCCAANLAKRAISKALGEQA